ncbi:MAG TPA: amidohydrolase family protein [Acidobacteriota bacterium]|nr:amidohydrolase family protein [Acidobacteriota bacterium]
MSKSSIVAYLALGLVLCQAALWAQEAPKAFVGARIIPIEGPEIENGILLIENGKITAVGSSAAMTLPADTEQIDVSGRVIMPGLIDSHSHIGELEGGDRSAPIQPDIRVWETVNARDSRIQKAQAGGITVANVMPGSGHLLSGQTVYLKLRDGNTVEDLIIPWEDGSPRGGMKMANGTNSRRNPPFPGTRAKSAALVREEYLKAQEYRAKIEAAEDDEEKMPARDLRMEGLLEVLEGKRIVHHHTHRHDDILTVLRLAEEFGFKVVLQHVSDAWAVAEEIAASDQVVGNSIIMIESPGGKIEAKDITLENAAILEEAGALVGFHTDDGITDSRLFLRSAGWAVRAGMSREKALYGLTMANAIMLDLQDRVGTLEPGKDADFIILDGDPLSVYSKVRQTWVDGVKVFDRDDPQDRLYAVGGYGASNDQANEVHQLSQEADY